MGESVNWQRAQSTEPREYPIYNEADSPASTENLATFGERVNKHPASNSINYSDNRDQVKTRLKEAKRTTRAVPNGFESSSIWERAQFYEENKPMSERNLQGSHRTARSEISNSVSSLSLSPFQIDLPSKSERYLRDLERKTEAQYKDIVERLEKASPGMAKTADGETTKSNNTLFPVKLLKIVTANDSGYSTTETKCRNPSVTKRNSDIGSSLGVTKRNGDIGSSMDIAKRNGDTGSSMGVTKRNGDTGSSMDVTKHNGDTGSSMDISKRNGDIGRSMGVTKRNGDTESSMDIAKRNGDIGSSMDVAKRNGDIGFSLGVTTGNDDILDLPDNDMASDASLPVTLHRIVVTKQDSDEDFGFSVSERIGSGSGIYVKSIQPSEDRSGKSGKLKKYDRILQVSVFLYCMWFHNNNNLYLYR